MPAKIEMTGDEAKLVKSFQRAIQQLQRVEDKLDKVGKTGKKTGGALETAGKKGSGAFDPQKLKSFVVGLGAGAVLAAQRLITAELEKQRTIQQQAAETQVTLSGARQSIIRNLFGQSSDTIKQALASSTRISGETGVKEKVVAQALASALSASGQNLPASAGAVRTAARFLPDDPSAIAGFAGSLLDLAKVSGTTNPTVNLGFLANAGALSRVVDPRQQAQNIPRSLIGQRAFGATAAESVALFGALSTAGGDIKGATTGTATIALGEQLRRFFKEQGLAGGTTGARISTLQQHPALARQFLEKASFEKVAKGPIEKLLPDTTSEAAKLYAQNLKQIPNAEGLRTLGAQAIRNQLLDPLASTARVQRALQTGTEAIQAGDIQGGLGGVLRKELAATLNATGEGALSGKIKSLFFDVKTDLGRRGALKTASELLRGRAQQLTNPDAGATADMFGFGGTGSPATPSAQELSNAELLRALAEKLDAILDEMKRNTTATQRVGQSPSLSPDRPGLETVPVGSR